MEKEIPFFKILNVLLLEDSDIDFELICEQLINNGYHNRISRAITEPEFTASIRSNVYDIILADYKLPQFDAFEALKLCNKYCPDVPFICVSGAIGEILAIELLKMGAVDYVLKDRMERLPFAVKRALEDAKEKVERREIEESLHRSEEKYRTIFENVQDVFYQTDLAGIIKEISPSIKYFSDFDVNELIGKPVFEIYADPKERGLFLQILTEKGEVRDYEIKLKTKTGEFKYASINARLLFDSKGTPDHIDGAIRDITLRKLAEESLQQSEQRLQDIIFSTEDWVWEVDEFGRYTYSSQKDLEIFGVSQDEIIGKTRFDFMPEDEAIKIKKVFLEIAEKRVPIKDMENWNIGKDGKLICLLTNGVPILDKNCKLIGYRGVDKNITDRKIAEQELIRAKEKAEASDRLKSSFLNMISHEIRTPITEIQGYSQIFANLNLTQEEKNEYLAIVKTSSQRLINTVTSYIDMSMIASNNLKVTKTNFSVEYFMYKIAETFRPICYSKNIELFEDVLADSDDAFIYTDEDLLTKVLYHLVDNAIKFTSKGSVTIGYQFIDHSHCFYIKDTGIGISQEMQQNIFRDFMQADNSDSRQYEGNGLGLSIASGLINLLLGHIWVESEIGKGSTFRFSLSV